MVEHHKTAPNNETDTRRLPTTQHRRRPTQLKQQPREEHQPQHRPLINDPIYNPIVSKDERGVETVADNRRYGTKVIDLEEALESDPNFLEHSRLMLRAEARVASQYDPSVHMTGDELEVDVDQMDYIEAKNTLANLGIPRHSGSAFRSTTGTGTGPGTTTTSANTPTPIQRIDYDSFYNMDTTVVDNHINHGEGDGDSEGNDDNMEEDNLSGAREHDELPHGFSEALGNDPFH